MYSGIVRTALTNGLRLELDYREPREVAGCEIPGVARKQPRIFRGEIQALIADDFKRPLHQI